MIESPETRPLDLDDEQTKKLLTLMEEVARCIERLDSLNSLSFDDETFEFERLRQAFDEFEASWLRVDVSWGLLGRLKKENN